MKHRQPAPSFPEYTDGTIINTESMTDIDDFDLTKPNKACPHLKKGIFNNIKAIEKCIKSNKLDQECSDCIKSGIKLENDDYEYDKSLWLCLKCGFQGCSRNYNKHAFLHYEVDRSEPHSVCVNTTNWLLWCYKCDNYITIDSNKNAVQIIDFIRKKYSSDSQPLASAIEKSPSPPPVIVSAPITLPLSVQKVDPVLQNLPRVRGLSNLGNTCFFNAVMQCLARTPFLLEVIKEMEKPGEKFCLPGGKIKHGNREEILPPIQGELSGWGPLTECLANTLEEMQRSGDVITPRKLLLLVRSKMPQFHSGDQEDSHELLRHLLEAVRTEDMKRYQEIVLESMGESKKTIPNNVDGDKKQTIKFYGRQILNMLLRPEQVFCGTLESTLQCQDCYNVSVRNENFLDLSLPVTVEKIQTSNIHRRKVEVATYEAHKPSKHQLKKEKRAAKKAAKKNKKNHAKQDDKALNFKSGHVEAGSKRNVLDVSESEHSDADIEDNVDDNQKNLTSKEQEKTGFGDEKYTWDVNEKEKMCSDDNDDSNDSTQLNIDGDNKPSIGDADEELKVLGQDVALVLKNESQRKESNLPDGIASTRFSPVDIGEIAQSTAPVLSPIRLKWYTESQSSTTLDNNVFNFQNVKTGYNNNNNPIGPKNELEFSTGGNATIGTSLSIASSSSEPISARTSSFLSRPSFDNRYNDEIPECSIHSCLAQFTATEEMTDANKVYCEKCSKSLGNISSSTNSISNDQNSEDDDDDDDKGNVASGGPPAGKKNIKPVYTNSTKQLLISSPPAILILHLKRFQVWKYHFRKVIKPVKFPLILDISQYCTENCRRKEMKKRGANKSEKILYALYGIVEHSGTLYSGHYVAYVKVRPKLEKNDPRWKFLPKNKINTSYSRGRKLSRSNNDSGLSNTSTSASSTSSSSSSSSMSCSLSDEDNLSSTETSAGGPSGVTANKFGMNEDGNASDDESEIKPPPGKWYYVSDSCTNEVSEAKVLNAEAYLLFYERIY